MVEAIKIGHQLIEAYKGYYEDERVVQQDDGSFKVVTDFTPEEWNIWIHWKIISDTPSMRLERYLEWNSIIGYASSIYDIATGKVNVSCATLA